MSVTQLALSYQDLLVRSRKRGTILKKETVSITKKIEEFARRLQLGQREALSNLMSAHPDRSEIVVTFLASIELSKHQKVHLMQEGTYEPIYIELLQELGSLHLGLVSEFETPSVVANENKSAEVQFV
jgi:segregation and condensation protein A